MATDLNWKNDVQLSQELQDKYETYKEAYRMAKELRLEFEQAVIDTVTAELPAGHTLAFSYNFGKLGIAVAPERGKPRAVAKSKPTLSSLFG